MVRLKPLILLRRKKKVKKVMRADVGLLSLGGFIKD